MTKQDKWRNLEDVLARWDQRIGLDSVYVYRTEMRGDSWYGVLYRDYPTVKEAQAALDDLPAALKRYQPFVRSIDKVARRDR